jgi:hypothetical protein
MEGENWVHFLALASGSISSLHSQKMNRSPENIAFHDHQFYNELVLFHNSEIYRSISSA